MTLQTPGLNHRVLHRLSASSTNPQTSQWAVRLSSIPSAALCSGLAAAGQDSLGYFT